MAVSNESVITSSASATSKLSLKPETTRNRLSHNTDKVVTVVDSTDVVEVDASQLTYADGKCFIKPDKIKDLIKDQKVVLAIESKQVKKKRKVKFVNESKIRKGKLAKELKRKRKEETNFILRTYKRMDLLNKVISVYCTICKDKQYDMIIKYAESGNDPENHDPPRSNYIKFTCCMCKHSNLMVEIIGIHTIDHIIECMNSQDAKYYLDLPVQDYLRSTMHKRRKSENNSNKSKSSCYINCTSYFVARQLPDHDPRCPLLPPDNVYYDGKDYSFEGINDARVWYNSLMKFDKKSKFTKRKYLWGSHHNHMFGFDNINVIDWNQCNDIDIKVYLEDEQSTMIKVRKAPSTLADKITKLHMCLTSTRGNARGKRTGDCGQMIALGRRNKMEEYVLSKNNHEIQNLMSDVGMEREEWFKSEFETEYQEQFTKKENILPYMSESLTDFMVHSIALVNSSHYDYSDETHTITTWIEEVKGITDNWYLVFPNVTTDCKNILVIQLFHGCTICWDASVLRHASSKINYNNSEDLTLSQINDNTEATRNSSTNVIGIERDTDHSIDGRRTEIGGGGGRGRGNGRGVATREDRRGRGRRRRRNGRSAGNCQLRRKS